MDAPSPLLGKYLVRNPLANRLLRGIDYCLRFGTSSTPPAPVAPPSRILLANGAHLGDVLLSTAVLPVLKQAYPQAEIGFLLGTWARPVLDGHPLVDTLHFFDHWKLNRTSTSVRNKISRYRATRMAALRDIRARRYDISLDLYYYFPNSIPLLWQAGIPVRIGYTSGGFGPLLTHALEWRCRDCHVVDYQRALLDELPLGSARTVRGAPSLPPVESAGINVGGDYLVLHPGTGHRIKEWPLSRWCELVERLSHAGHTLVFTGTSAAERDRVDQMVRGRPRCLNECGRQNWQEFVATVRSARLLIGVDSVAGHVAAAVGTPCVVIGTGITHPAHFRPLSDRCRMLSAPVACSPCYRGRGCATMACVREISAPAVHAAVLELLDQRVPACSTN